MVCMLMGDKNSSDPINAYVIIAQYTLKLFCAAAAVDKHTASRRFQIIAVSRASAEKRTQPRHLFTTFAHTVFIIIIIRKLKSKCKAESQKRNNSTIIHLQLLWSRCLFSTTAVSAARESKSAAHSLRLRFAGEPPVPIRCLFNTYLSSFRTE